MTAKLTHFAHPRGWEKGEPVNAIGERGVQLARDLFSLVDDKDTSPEAITTLAFSSPEYRDQWLKWWRKA